MPEIHFRVRWPDQSESLCYSPSRVIKDYLNPGQSYPLPEFVQRCREALPIASERVRQKYGYCGGAGYMAESEMNRNLAELCGMPELKGIFSFFGICGLFGLQFTKNQIFVNCLA